MPVHQSGRFLGNKSKNVLQGTTRAALIFNIFFFFFGGRAKTTGNLVLRSAGQTHTKETNLCTWKGFFFVVLPRILRIQRRSKGMGANPFPLPFFIFKFYWNYYENLDCISYFTLSQADMPEMEGRATEKGE